MKEKEHKAALGRPQFPSTRLTLYTELFSLTLYTVQGKRIPLLRRFPCKCNYVCFRLGHMLPYGINRGKGNFVWEVLLKRVTSQNMLNVFISWPWKAVDHFCKPCTKRISSVLEGGRTQLLYKVALPDVHYYHYYIRTTPFSFPEPFSHIHSTFSVTEYGRVATCQI